MIKFFRKIRRNSLSEGRTEKYFKYALGEIILVVIGILIALQINNWNEQRKSNNQAISYLIAIQADLQTDLEQLKSNEDYLNQYESGGFNVWNYLYENGIESDTTKLIRDFLRLSIFREFSPTKTSYNNLVNSGNINQIKHDDLIKLLSIFYREDEFVKGTIAQRNRLENDYYDIRIKYIPLMMLRDHLAVELLKGKRAYTNFHSIAWDSIRKDKAYEEILGRILALRIPARYRIKVSRKKIAELLLILDNKILNE